MFYKTWWPGYGQRLIFHNIYDYSLSGKGINLYELTNDFFEKHGVKLG